ncbi:MAG: hypothetical protein ABSG05_03395 [Candidatus Pacearchaeota archaeon]|jgi:ABC-type multidrug transport system permease subunit
MNTKEFFTKWKQGIEAITPYQQVRGQLFSIIPIFIGIIIGIIVTIKSHTWWLVLILGGSLILTFFQFIGMLQRFLRLRVQRDIMKSMQDVIPGGSSETKTP